MRIYTAVFGLLICNSVLAEDALNAETELEEVTITGTAEEQTSTSLPVKTEKLNDKAANTTLGGYLDALPNVDSASYGEAVGRPVVRGMSGYRVKVLHNDNALNDLSAMSQDHAVAVAPRASERIELLKGPASLLYAAQAGGVLTDHRLDSDSNALDARVSVANDSWALRLGGLHQESDAYESGKGETIDDSDITTTQAQVGLSWKPNSRSELQFNATKLDKDYGIPNSTPEATRIDMSREDLGIKFKYQPTLE
ncbi:putative TonB-dependent receptor [Nymphon striatum]|nr:putative TonB-dependent receptor [Nymphon striatum]